MNYLASPYSHPDKRIREQRYHAACWATANLIRRGMVLFSPIVQGHPLVAQGLPTDWAWWERFDRAVLERCDAILVLTLDGWQQSVGVTAEIRIAGNLGKPVRYLVPDDTGSPTFATVAAEVGP